MIATLDDLLSELSTAPELPLVFEVDGVRIRPAYHVTEVKVARIKATDCGKGKAEWDETLVELLDGPARPDTDGEFMTAGKFCAIAREGLRGLGDNSGGDLYFEFAPGNGAAGKHRVRRMIRTEESWQVRLQGVRAVCKPALRGRTQSTGEVTSTGGSCCGSIPEKAGCCTA